MSTGKLKAQYNRVRTRCVYGGVLWVEACCMHASLAPIVFASAACLQVQHTHAASNQPLCCVPLSPSLSAVLPCTRRAYGATPLALSRIKPGPTLPLRHPSTPLVVAAETGRQSGSVHRSSLKQVSTPPAQLLTAAATWIPWRTSNSSHSYMHACVRAYLAHTHIQAFCTHT